MTIQTINPKATFIHIPKNAGTSISQWLIIQAGGRWVYQNHYGGKHFTLNQIRKVDKNDLGITFACVRNPWDRLVSGFFYYRKQRKFKDRTFEEFIRGRNWHQLSKPQSDYFQPNEIDHVLRFENLHHDFKIIQQIFKCDKPITKRNGSNHKSYKDYYTDELIEIVAQRHKADIIRFGYKFE